MSDTLALQPHRRIVFEQTIGELGTFSYLIGNTKPNAIDMSACTAFPVRCLFLGSGDLRHAFHLIHASTTITQWDIYLVDINPAVVARNLLFLQALREEKTPSTIIWSIWYDFLLDSDTNKYLQKLICTTLASELGSVRENDRTIIINTLLSWLHFTIIEDSDRIQRQRREHLERFLKRNRSTTLTSFVNTSRTEITEILHDEPESKIHRAQDEIELYIYQGVTGTNATKSHINVTMLQPLTNLYTGHFEMDPFHSYFPFESESEINQFRATTEDESYPLFKYCLSKFDEWIRSCRKCSKNVTWHLWCGDALNLALFHMPLLEFDLIHTSNLADHIGVLDILVTCMPLLRHRSSSRILTQSMNWWNLHGHCIDYLQHVFNGIDLTWLPSLLGLKAECVRDPGRHFTQSITKTKKMMTGRATKYCDYQTWRLAHGVHIRCDTIHQDTLNALDQLAERCFYPPNTVINALNGLAISTTLTYYLLLRQYTKRCYVRSDEIFEYLFYRTCSRYRSYATGFRALHDFFTDETTVNTYQETLVPYPKAHYKTQAHLPMLQLLIIDDVGNTSIDGILQMRNVNLALGRLTSSANGQAFSFHLIDNFTFKMANRTFEKDKIQAYTLLAENASIEFILPSSFASWKSSGAFLIDTHSWYPFARVSLSSPKSITHWNASFSMSVRDAVCSCSTQPTDRALIIVESKSRTSIQLMNAYETVSDYHLSFRKDSCKNSISLPLLYLSIDEKLQSLIFIFTGQRHYQYPVAFPCPLQWYVRPIKQENNVMNVTLPKDTAELLSSILFNRNTPIFDRQQLKPWPAARLPNGQAIPFPNDIESVSFRDGDFHTLIMYRALDSMFSFWENFMSKREDVEQNIDRSLRRNLYTIFTYVFLRRCRLFQYLRYDEQQTNLLTELVFVVDGIYRCESNEEEPLLALVYLDVRHPKQNQTQSMAIFERERKIQAKQIAEARGSSYPTDDQPFSVAVSWNEANLMRKLLKYNSKKMTSASKKHNFPIPWKASFLELLRADSRGSCFTRFHKY